MDSSFHQLDDAKARALHLLTCPLCSTQYQDPRVLPCQHTFCCRCLLAHVDGVQSSRSTRLGAFPCPQCNADVGLPAAGASAFPVDQRIRNIRDLFVEEMAKGLASKIKERRKGDGVCNGVGDGVGDPVDDVHSRKHGGRSAATRLSDIHERPGVNDGDGDDVNFGTWPSSARARRLFGDESANRAPANDDPAFSRHGMGYSSVRVGSRRSRTHETLSQNYDDARFEAPTFSDSAQTTGGTTTPPDADARFSRNMPGYFSMRVPRSRRTRTGLADMETQFDGMTVPEGRTSSFADPHASSQYSQRSSSYVDVHSKSSPFDNINRDDDASETYTPIIGRHRIQYFSLRERRRRPLFDPNQLYENPADVVDEDLCGSDGSGRFSRVTHNRHAGIPEFDGNLRRTVSSDLNWTRHTSGHAAGEQRPSRNSRDYGSDRARTSGRECAGETGTGENITAQRQRADSLDTSVLTVLSNLPADVKTRMTKSKVPDCAATSAGDRSQSQTPVNQPGADVCHRTSPSESPITFSTTYEVPSTSQTPSNVASQVNERCAVDVDRTGDTASSKQTEPTTSYSADSYVDSSAGKCSSHASTLSSRSTDINDSLHQTDVPVDNRKCSLSEEGIYSPPRSPNESCFSRLTKFRSSKNSRQAASSTSSSAADSTSKEPSTSTHDADSSTASKSKSRVRKRPAAFVGSAFSFPVSSTGEHTATSPSPVDRNDEINAESDKEQQSHQQFELRPSSVSSGAVNVGVDITSFDAEGKGSQTVADVADSRTCSSNVSPTAETDSASELPPSVKSDTESIRSDKEQQSHQQFELRPSSVSSGAVNVGLDVTSFDADVKASQTVAEVADSRTSDVSPTAETDSASELLPSVESNDVQSSVDDVTASQLTAQQRHDDDSAVFSASEASVRSAVEPCTTTPTTDDEADADDVLVKCDRQDGETDDTRRRLDNDDCGLTTSEGLSADDVMTDFNVERHQDAAELMNEENEVDQNGVIGNGDAKEDDDNEDDVTSNNKMSTEKDEVGEDGRSSEADDVIDDGCVLATGVTALGDGSLVLADYGAGCVRLCDDEGHTEHRVTGVKPFSVATSTSMIAGDDDQLIYVGDRRRKTLVVLDRHGADVAQWPDNQFDWICGIACLPDGELAVLDRSRTRQLGIYSASGDDGRPLTELGGQGSSLGDLCMAEFVAADSRGRVLVSDSGNHCVKAFDRRVAPPGVVAVYGTTRGSGDAQLEWPKGVAVDSADNVLVADCRNGRVVSFSVDGRSLGSVVPAVRGPFAVCTLPPASPCQRCRLAVTTYSVSGVSEFRFYDYDTEAMFV